MTIINPIPPIGNYTPPFMPITNITPFTYRDGATYLEVLETLRAYLNGTLVPYINDNMAELGDEFAAQVNTLIDTINAQLSAQNDAVTAQLAAQNTSIQEAIDSVVNSSITVSDPVVLGIVNNINSESRKYLDTIYAKTVNGKGFDAVGNITIGKVDVGLENVDDTADADKPVSTATQTALDTKIDKFADPGHDALVFWNDSTNEYVPLTVESPLSLSADGVQIATATDLVPGVTRLATPDEVTAGTLDTVAVTPAANAEYSRWFAKGDEWYKRLGHKVGFVGDSYMTGYEMADPTKRWPTKFCTQLGVTENNVAVGGTGYNNGGASNMQAQASLLDVDCTHVIVCGGINDAPLGYSDAQMQSYVTAVIANIRARIPNVPITVISPMWYSIAPTDQLLTVAKNVRAAVMLADDVDYIENAEYLRLDRSNSAWQSSDGHPQEYGAEAINQFVQLSMRAMTANVRPLGQRNAVFTRADTGDVPFGTGQVGLVGGALYDAAPGWYRIESSFPIYSSAQANGFKYIKVTAGGVDTWSKRDDIVGGTIPRDIRHEIIIFHGGGILTVEAGYNASSGTPTAITAGVSVRMRVQRIEL